jgi:hypothetical protein|tara:strand:- start:150 stop:614 length:465 start_codon:yes stop_codon:yes gene_type:complete
MIMDMFGMEKLWNMFITPVLPKKHYFLEGLLGGLTGGGGGGFFKNLMGGVKKGFGALKGGFGDGQFKQGGMEKMQGLLGGIGQEAEGGQGKTPEELEEEERRLMESQVGTQGFNQGPTQLNPIQSQGGQFGYNAGSQGMRGLQNARRPGGSGGY